MANFELYFPTLLKHEGGFVNNPNDPGGATNKGITLKTFRAMYKPTATVEDLKNISNVVVKSIYKKNYWNLLNLDLIKNQKLAETVFDMGVNAGVSRSAKMLQYVANTILPQNKSFVIDGIIGSKSIEKINAINGDVLYNQFNELRKTYYLFRTATKTEKTNDTVFINTQLKVSPNPSQVEFEKGWLKRVDSFKPIQIAAVAGGGAVVLLLLFAGLFFLTKKK